MPNPRQWAAAACLAACVPGGLPLAALDPVRSTPGVALAVVAPDREHLAFAAATRLAREAARHGLDVAATLADRASEPDLLVLPVRSLAHRVPALQALELPFLFADLAQAHAALDGALGAALRAQARQAGWEILAFWDEGLHAMSGNRRFDRRINLTGTEFLLLRPDPVAELQFRAFDAWTRAARPESRDELLRECLVGSRAASLQQVLREELARVHLDLSLTQHRYEGWILAAPAPRWGALTDSERGSLVQAAAATLAWQRADAGAREAAALAALTAQGMRVFRLGAERRREFVERLPPRAAMLPAGLDPGLNRLLDELAGD